MKSSGRSLAVFIVLAVLASPGIATTQCGNAVTDPGEDCDDGGTCIGGSNAGTHCTAESDCPGSGVCIGGTHAHTACANDAACPGSACRHCVPQGGDGCAANCTFEHDVPFPMVPGQLNGLQFVPGTSGANLTSDFLSIPLPLGDTCDGGVNVENACYGNDYCPGAHCQPATEILTLGKQRDGRIPLVVRASSIRFGGIPVGSLACGCVIGVAAKTCGGVLFEEDGVTAALDCTPRSTAGDSVCVAAGKLPCAFVHGVGNMASGEIGCDGLDGTDVAFVQDSGGKSGVAGPPTIATSGNGGPGSASVLQTAGMSAILAPCTGSDPGTYGPDGRLCTADDPPGFVFLVATSPAVTGTVSAVLRNTNGADGANLGPETATGVPFNCAALAGGSAAGAGLVQAFGFVHVDTIGDVALINQFFASGAVLPTPTPVPPLCLGDCDGNGSASVDELIIMVNIVLGNTSLAACPSADTDGTGTVSIVQLVLGVRNLLYGCADATPASTLEGR